MLAAEHGVGASVPTVSAAGTTPTALRPRRPCRVVNARVGHQAGLRCPPYRRPEQRRPPYARAAPCRVVNARVGHQAGLRCPPYRRPEQRRPPYARAAVVGWSTPRVGHQVGLRCPPYRRPEQRRPPYARAALVGWSTPALATRRGFGAHRIGGRNNADRPTPAPPL